MPLPHHAPRCAIAALASLLAALPACSCDPCSPPEETALDYVDEASWLCRPGAARDACSEDLSATEVRPDGSFARVEHAPAAAPEVDCFYVYPTMDWRLGAGVHTDFDDNAREAAAALNQAARFTEVCRLYAPLYRQVTLGTYAARDEVRSACFDTAYADVLRAFKRYLDHDNQGRGVVLLGHSQGGMHTTRLLAELFDGGKALAQQLVAALPIGWPLGVKAGERSGGSLETIPTCERTDETGCVIGFRSYAEDHDFPEPAEAFLEGDQVVCTNPADLEANSRAHLSRAFLRTGIPQISAPEALGEPDTPFLLYRDFFSAQCVEQEGQPALEIAAAPDAGDVRDNPVNFDALLLSGNNGTHILDVSFALGDLIDLTGAKIGAYTAAGGE